MPYAFLNLKSLLIALDSGKSICYLCGDQIAAFPILAQNGQVECENYPGSDFTGFLCSYQG
jgi:hypothetical protein